MRKCRAVNGQAECLKNQMMADILGLKSRVTTVELCPIFLCDDNLKII